VDAVVALCYRCNLQCVTCDLASRGPEALTPDILRGLPPSLAYVNVTGGEPLLLDDLVPSVRAIYEATGAEITISTNGTLPERTAEVVRELRGDVPSLRVAVSIDGPEATHDRIRQAPGAFRKALATVERLHPLLGTNLHLAVTISAANAAEFDDVASLAREFDLPLSLALTHVSEHYFRPQAEAVPAKEEALTAIDAAARYYLREFAPRAAGRAYFAAGLATVVTTGRRPLPCRAGDRFFYLDPLGQVYLCNMRVETLGSLAQTSFEAVWERRRRRELLATTGEACPIQCWMVCTARTSIQDHPLRVATWAARAYLHTWCGAAAPRP